MSVLSVITEVVDERARQDLKWGEQNHPDGTGPDSQPLFANTATGIADDDEASLIRDMMTGRTDWRFSIEGGDRPGTWTDILLEEVFEALAEDDPAKLRRELIQVAAVATQWAEAIDRRTSTLCRDCTEGKHGACIGSAFVERGPEIDEVACGCPDAVHGVTS